MAWQRPTLAPVRSGGAALDTGVGFLNGVLGGATGFAGILVTIWSGLRGWPKDVQRTVFQPVGVADLRDDGAVARGRGSDIADTGQAVSHRACPSCSPEPGSA